MSTPLHHIGYVVDNIDFYSKHFPFLELSKSVFDPIQKAEIKLFKQNSSQGIFYEFIKPTSNDSFTWKHLAKNGSGFHHICYGPIEPKKLEQIVHAYKLLKIRGPIYANLFNREVSFYMTRTKSLIEFII